MAARLPMFQLLDSMLLLLGFYKTYVDPPATVLIKVTGYTFDIKHLVPA